MTASVTGNLETINALTDENKRLMQVIEQTDSQVMLFPDRLSCRYRACVLVLPVSVVRTFDRGDGVSVLDTTAKAVTGNASGC